MTRAMTRSDRSWTAVIAECGLDRARPLLANLMPQPFRRIDLGRALAATGLTLDRQTPFADLLRPALENQLGPDAETVLHALARLPFDADLLSATAFWRGMLRNLHGANAPALLTAKAADWFAFVETFRGRTREHDVPDWLKPVAAEADDLRDLASAARMQRALPLTRHDRSLYARFGWNDDGDIPGLSGLLDAAALLRTQRAWAAAADRFDAEDRDKIQTAADRIVTAERASALETADADARRYGVPRAEIETRLHPPRPVPPLNDILAEAA